jgi:hypothetical protein
MELSPSIPDTTETPVGTSPSVLAANAKQQLLDATNTRDVIFEFRDAILNATFDGRRVTSIAKGIAFLDAVLAQTQAVIAGLRKAQP